MGNDFVIIVEFHAEVRVGEEFLHSSLKLEQFFFGHWHPWLRANMPSALGSADGQDAVVGKP
jgi:hypothetical protein